MLTATSSCNKKKTRFRIIFDEAVEREGNPANIYLFNVNIRNTRRCEICSTLTKTPERRH